MKIAEKPGCRVPNLAGRCRITVVALQTVFRHHGMHFSLPFSGHVATFIAKSPILSHWDALSYPTSYPIPHSILLPCSVSPFVRPSINPLKIAEKPGYRVPNLAGRCRTTVVPLQTIFWRHAAHSSLPLSGHVASLTAKASIFSHVDALSSILSL